MEMCSQGFRFHLNYDLKSQALFCYCTILHRPSTKMYCSLACGLLEDLKEGGPSPQDVWVQGGVSEASWVGPAKPLKFSLQRETVMLCTTSPSPASSGERPCGAFSVPSQVANTQADMHSQAWVPLSPGTTRPNPVFSGYDLAHWNQEVPNTFLLIAPPDDLQPDGALKREWIDCLSIHNNSGVICFQWGWNRHEKHSNVSLHMHPWYTLHKHVTLKCLGP